MQRTVTSKKIINLKLLLRRSAVVFSFILISIANADAQTETPPDVLAKQLSAPMPDTAKAGLYAKISSGYFFNDPEQALQYALEGLKFVRNRELDNYLPALNFAAANACNALGKDDSAMILLSQSIKGAKLAKNVEVELGALRTQGAIFIREAKFKEATDVLFNGLKLADEVKNEDHIASFNSTICALYIHQANYEKAVLYGEKAGAYFKRSGNLQKMASSYVNLGLAYAEMENKPKAQDYYEKALAAYIKTDYKVGLATTYGNLSNIVNNDEEKRIGYLLKAQEIWNSFAPEHPNAVGNTGNLGMAYLTLSEDSNFNKLKQQSLSHYTKAELLQKAETNLSYAVEMCKKLKFDRDQAFFTEVLASLYEKKGNYKTANTYLKEYIKLSDTLYSQENKNIIAEAEGKYVIDHKNSELAINQLTIANNRKTQIGLVAGLALLVVIGALLYYQGRTRKKTNEQLVQLNSRLDEANKTKTTFFAILSHDLRSPVANLVNFLQLQKRAPEVLDASQKQERENKIGKAAETLLETMETMLLWSKGQMEKFQPEIKRVAVTDMFDYLQKFFSGTEGVNIVFSDPQHLFVSSDENYLQTIMQNLTANAVKALNNTPDATIEWKAEKAGDKIKLCITDNGPGMASGDFLQISDQPQYNSRTGLGMHLVRDLAAAIDCDVTMEQPENGGTKFCLALKS